MMQQRGDQNVLQILTKRYSRIAFWAPFEIHKYNIYESRRSRLLFMFGMSVTYLIYFGRIPCYIMPPQLCYLFVMKVLAYTAIHLYSFMTSCCLAIMPRIKKAPPFLYFHAYLDEMHED